MNEDDSDDCPFIYKPGEEPEPIIHEIIGVCFHCGGEAQTTDDYGNISCFPCAYHIAN